MSFSIERAGGCGRRELLLSGAMALLAPKAAAQQLRRLAPPEQRELPEIQTLVEQMRKLVQARDARGLTALMLPDFRVEFDAGKGPIAFRRYWKPEQSASPVWEILDRILAMEGDCVSSSIYCRPYLHTAFPRDLDPLAYVVSTGANATLRDSPDKDGAARTSLDHSILRLSQPLSPPVIIRGDGYLSIDDPDAGRGFVAASDVYSPAAHRIFFNLRNGKWRWISLAAATLADPPDLKAHASQQ